MTDHRKGSNSGELRRRTRRAAVLWNGRLARGQEESSCAILSLSTGGARLRLAGAEELPPSVALESARFGRIDSRVVWRHGNVVGLAFLDGPDIVARRFEVSLPEGLRAAVA